MNMINNNINIKYFFATINTLLIIVMAYFCVNILYEILIPYSVEKNGFHNSKSNKKSVQVTNKTLKKNRYNIVVNRNLFKAEIKEKTIQKADDLKNLEVTKLKLVLWGTVIGVPHFYAVIEDKKKRSQALYKTGDMVQGAIIKNIFRNMVVLSYVNGVPIKSMKEALYIYSQIKGKEDMDVVLNREGIEKKILVTIEKD